MSISKSLRLGRFHKDQEGAIYGNLSGLGIGVDRVAEMAKKCTDGDRHTTGQFVKLTSVDIEKIYRLAE